MDCQPFSSTKSGEDALFSCREAQEPPCSWLMVDNSPAMNHEHPYFSEESAEKGLDYSIAL